MPQENISPTFKPESESEYQKATLKFTEAMENPNLSLDEKLKELIALADKMGTDPQNIEHFNNTILDRWVKIKNPELYEAYQKTMYQKATLKFTEAMEDPHLSLDEKLEKLEALADEMGTNPKDIEHFNNTILERWVKIKNPELYEAYQETMSEAI